MEPVMTPGLSSYKLCFSVPIIQESRVEDWKSGEEPIHLMLHH